MKIIQSIPVDTTKLKNGPAPIASVISALKAYLRANPDELYATPQLLDDDNPLSIIVLRIIRNKQEVLMTLINPMLLGTRNIIASEETQKGIEGTYLNFRHTHLHLAYNALPAVTPTEVTLSGKSALIFQQAFRLTQGITVDVFGLRIDDYAEYQNADDEGKQKIISDYREALKQIQSEMLEDADVKEYVKATEFVAANVQKSVNDEFVGQLQTAYDEISAQEESGGECGEG